MGCKRGRCPRNRGFGHVGACAAREAGLRLSTRKAQSLYSPVTAGRLPPPLLRRPSGANFDEVGGFSYGDSVPIRSETGMRSTVRFKVSGSTLYDVLFVTQRSLPPWTENSSCQSVDVGSYFPPGAKKSSYPIVVTRISSESPFTVIRSASATPVKSSFVDALKTRLIPSNRPVLCRTEYSCRMTITRSLFRPGDTRLPCSSRS